MSMSIINNKKEVSTLLHLESDIEETLKTSMIISNEEVNTSTHSDIEEILNASMNNYLGYGEVGIENHIILPQIYKSSQIYPEIPSKTHLNIIPSQTPQIYPIITPSQSHSNIKTISNICTI